VGLRKAEMMGKENSEERQRKREGKRKIQLTGHALFLDTYFLSPFRYTDFSFLYF